MHLLQSCSLVSVNLGFQDEGHKECMFDDAQASGAANPYLRTELQPLWKSDVCPTLGVQVTVGTITWHHAHALIQFSHLQNHQESLSAGKCHLTFPKRHSKVDAKVSEIRL